MQTERYRAAESTPEVQKAMTAMLKEFPVISQNKYGFNWPLAHDYFACHRGHNISMPPYVSLAILVSMLCCFVLTLHDCTIVDRA